MEVLEKRVGKSVAHRFCIRVVWNSCEAVL